jgi:ATP-binding cassette, subfamily F, member 3
MLEKMTPITAPGGGAQAVVFTFPGTRGTVAPRSSTSTAPPSAMAARRCCEAEPAHRPGRPDRPSGPQRRGEIDAVEAAGGQTQPAKAGSPARPSCASAISRSIRWTSCTSTRRRCSMSCACAPPRPAPAARAAGGFGLMADQAETVVGRLSGGQKARLSLLLATIDAPHLLILDEPTNHLDMESREALVEALTEYSGAVILVSHDMHLLGLVADRLWLVKGGASCALHRGPGRLPPPASGRRRDAEGQARPEKPKKRQPRRGLALPVRGPQMRGAAGQAEPDARQAGDEAGRSRAL